MTLTQHQPIRQCGKRFGTENEASLHKLALAGTHEVVPCSYGCGGYHLERIQVPSVPVRTAPKDTGPSAKVRAIVLERDGYACVCCGVSIKGKRYSLGHRLRASQGGKAVPSNLLTFLGLGGEGCHGRIDNRTDPHDEAKGYTIRSGGNPAMVGVMYFSPHGSGVLMYLDDEGGISPDAPKGETA